MSHSYELGGVLNLGILSIATTLAYLGLDSPARSGIRQEVEDVRRIVEEEVGKVRECGLLNHALADSSHSNGSLVCLRDGWLTGNLLIEVRRACYIAGKKLITDDDTPQRAASPDDSFKRNRRSLPYLIAELGLQYVKLKRNLQTVGRIADIHWSRTVLIARRADIGLIASWGGAGVLLQIYLTLRDACTGDCGSSITIYYVLAPLIYFTLTIVLVVFLSSYVRSVYENDVIELWAKEVTRRFEEEAQRQKDRKVGEATESLLESL